MRAFRAFESSAQEPIGNERNPILPRLTQFPSVAQCGDGVHGLILPDAASNTPQSVSPGLREGSLQVT